LSGVLIGAGTFLAFLLLFGDREWLLGEVAALDLGIRHA